MSNNKSLLSEINNTPKKTLMNVEETSAAQQIVQAKKPKYEVNEQNEVRTSYSISIRVYNEFKDTVFARGELIKDVVNRLVADFLDRDRHEITLGSRLDARAARTVRLNVKTRDRLEKFCDAKKIRQLAVIETVMIEYINKHHKQRSSSNQTELF